MAPRTTRRAGQPRDDYDVEMTMFGRVWRTSDWLIPFYGGVIMIVIAAVVNQAQAGGALPAGGQQFVIGCAGVTALGMLCGLMLGGSAVMTRRVTAWCVAMPLVGGLWVTYVSLIGMRNGLAPWISFLVLDALATASFRAVRDLQRDHELALIYAEAEVEEEDQLRHLADQLAQVQSPPVDEQEQQWLDFFAACRLPGMIYHGRHALRNGSGFLIHLEFPDDGSVTYDMVEQSTNRIEIQLFKRFRHLFDEGTVHPGCVRVQRATDRNKRPIVGEVFVTVDVVDILSKTLRMPTTAEDYTELSIMEAFQVGDFSDGTPIYLTIHEIHTLIIGQTQNGKSNLLHVLIRQLARCTDCVLWGLDFKGGDTIRLWMNAYMRGDIDPHTGQPLAKCIFDWVAVNDHIEAERILLSALEAANQRPAIVGGGGWVPSKTRPAIIVIADEISEIVGTTGGRGGRSAFHVGTDVLAGLLARMFKLGTGQGVYGITASQRGTVDSTGGGTAKSQQKGRILLPVTEGASDVLQGSAPEAARLAKSLVHKGSVVIEGFGHAVAKAGKIWLVGFKPEIQERVTHEVLALTHLRRDVALDPETAAFLVQYGYAGRPGGPAADPDRMCWYYGRKPSRVPLVWDYQYVPGTNDPVKTGDTGMPGAPSSTAGPGSTAAALGLDRVASPLHRTPAPQQPAQPSNVTPLLRPRATGTDPSWEKRQNDAMAGLVPDDPAPAEVVVQLPEPAPYEPPAAPEPPRPFHPRDLVTPGVDPSYENSMLLMMHLISAAGSSGIKGAQLRRQMEECDHAPRNRSSVYEWSIRLVSDTAKHANPAQKVIKEGDVFMTAANKPMPSRMAS